MILGFKKYIPHIGPTKFKEKIISGTKIHSIRKDEKDRWERGRKIQMAYGVRTKFYECFMKSECAGIESIVIFYPDDYGLHPAPNIFIHGQKLSYSECEELAENDGFESFSDFCTYFNNNFEGKIIHWTDKKYAALTSAEIDALLWA